MPEAYYIIPMVAGPYSFDNPQRPDYVDEIKCGWSGHNVDALGVFVCLVNTTEAKHTNLESRPGVRQLPRGYTWDTLISSLPAAARNFVNNWLTQHDLPAAGTGETIGDILQRIINSGLFSLGLTPLNTQFIDLNAEQKTKIVMLCMKWGLDLPADNETVGSLSRRCGAVWWPGNDRTRVKAEEF